MEPSLIEMKNQATLCMEDLFDKLELCARIGMLDTSSSYYNEVLLLKRTAFHCTSISQLGEVIEEGKTVEKNLDHWLAQKGVDTTALRWPKMPNI